MRKIPFACCCRETDQFSGVEQDDNSRVVDSLILESPIYSHKAVAPPSRMMRWVRLGFLTRALTTPLVEGKKDLLVEEKKDLNPLAVAAVSTRHAPPLSRAWDKHGTVAGLQEWQEEELAWSEQDPHSRSRDLSKSPHTKSPHAHKAHDPLATAFKTKKPASQQIGTSLSNLMRQSQDHSRSLSNIFKRNNQVLIEDMCDQMMSMLFCNDIRT